MGIFLKLGNYSTVTIANQIVPLPAVCKILVSLASLANRSIPSPRLMCNFKVCTALIVFSHSKDFSAKIAIQATLSSPKQRNQASISRINATCTFFSFILYLQYLIKAIKNEYNRHTNSIGIDNGCRTVNRYRQRDSICHKKD